MPSCPPPSNGAAAALIDDPSLAVETAGQLRVADRCRRWRRGRGGARTLVGQAVAITGSVGKIQHQDALRHVPSRQARRTAAASFNNHIGVPLTLARLPADARFGVFEVGTNHPGEIEPLARMVRADVAVITTVQPVHVEHFGTIEAIVREKGQIFAGAAGGTAVLERDSPHFRTLSDCPRPACNASSASARCSRRARGLRGGYDGSDVAARSSVANFAIASARRRHWARNSLAVLAAIGRWAPAWRPRRRRSPASRRRPGAGRAAGWHSEAATSS